MTDKTIEDRVREIQTKNVFGERGSLFTYEDNELVNKRVEALIALINDREKALSEKMDRAWRAKLAEKEARSILKARRRFVLP